MVTSGSCICPILIKIEGRTDKKVDQGKKQAPKVNKTYMFKVSKIEEIFNFLIKERFIIYLVGHYTLSTLYIKGKEYCNYHDVWTHSTVNYSAFRNVFQNRINKGILKFPKSPKKAMQVDKDPFPPIANVKMELCDL